MELLIAIAPMLIMGVVGYFVVLIQEWISDTRFYRRKMNRRSLGKVTCVEHTLPTGEVEKPGLGELFIFDKQKVGKVTGTSLQLNEAEKLIKEAKEKKI